MFRFLDLQCQKVFRSARLTLARSITWRKYETGLPVHDTDPLSGSICDTCMIVPMSKEKVTKRLLTPCGFCVELSEGGLFLFESGFFEADTFWHFSEFDMVEEHLSWAFSEVERYFRFGFMFLEEEDFSRWWWKNFWILDIFLVLCKN